MDATSVTARELLDQLRAREGDLPPDDLDRLWAAATPVRPDEVLGAWRGSELPTGHPASRMLDGLRWHGKRFHDAGHVDPLVCRDEAGGLFVHEEAARGGASLWSVEFRGEVTASMVYDGQPIVDHFKAVDPDTLVGVMNGKGVLADGQHFWFLLERE